MDKGLLFRRTSAVVNKTMLPALRTGPGRRLLGGSFAVVTYRGRRSGRELTLPVNYRRDRASGELVIGVMAPDAKTWWRNFTGEGGPVRVRLGDTEHEGHARAVRSGGGGVTVRVALT